MKTFMKVSALGCLFLILACGASTAPYENSEWKNKGIASLETIHLGNHPHSVLIRGTNKDNPLLIVIHGYAVPMMPFAHLDYADPSLEDGVTGEMEKHFIIVNYDQRGAGKTARNKAPDETMNIDQLVRDAEELTEIMRKRFNKDRVYILGISFGSIIGMKLAEKRPELFHAYISEGQAVNLPETYRDAIDFITEQAALENNMDALMDMTNTLPPSPENSTEINITNTNLILKWLEHYYSRTFSLQDLEPFFIKALWKAPEYTLPDMMVTLQSIETFTELTMQETMGIDMRKEVPGIDIPVYFIMGEYDVMKFAGRDYFNRLNAKEKHWLEIKKAGHAASADQPEEVLNIYKEILK